jgi:predicted metal-dependent hydrolase
MNEAHHIIFGGTRIEFCLRHSTRKTLGITVRPDTSVMVTAPLRAELDTIKRKVRKRAVWIRRQQRYFAGYLPTLPPRRFVSGETHRYLGRQYRLKVVEAAPPDVKLRGKFIWVQTPRKGDRARVRALVRGWYLRHAEARFARSLAEGVKRLGGRVSAPRLLLRRMPKRWGSWTKRGVVYLNPELILAPPSCIDYVVTHELCHLVHASHGRAFFALLQKAMPDWVERKARLEKAAAESGLGAEVCGQAAVG